MLLKKVLYFYQFVNPVPSSHAGKIDNLMKGFNARDADSSSSSDDDEPVARNALAVGAEMDSHAAVAAAVTVPASAKASEFDEPEFDDDDDLMMAKPSPVYDKVYDYVVHPPRNLIECMCL